MKSRTSYFDKTIFKKAMTRFAPAWILYTVCLLLGMFLMRQDNGATNFHRNLGQLPTMMSIINLFYALLAAQLLFGDLYNSRMCNMIHALPVTRESLFVSHSAAGFLWSIGPTLLGTLLALLLGIGSDMQLGWQIPLWWLLCSNLQYLFFFGLAAFSALCVGNRFAQAVVYFILNFASVIAYFLVDTLYTPMLYGLRTAEDPFMKFSPTVWFANSDYLDITTHWADGKLTQAWFTLGEGWGYLTICAVLGALLLICACLLYRRRSLECAGDFMAVKVLEPVFLVVYSLIIAAVFYYICGEMLGIGGIAIIYMSAGLIIGFFTGQMLLDRTIKVLSKKIFLKFAVLAAAFGITLVVTAMDPLGLTTWIPGGDEIAAVEVSPSYSGYYTYNMVALEKPEDIDDVLRTHEIALQDRHGELGIAATVDHPVEYGTDTYNPQTIGIHYHLKNGTMKSRYYIIDLSGEAGDLMIPHFNTFDAIFRNYEGTATLENILNATQTITVGCDSYDGTKYAAPDGYSVQITDKEEIRQLLEAIAADCEDGTMAQNYSFRRDPYANTSYWLDFDMGTQADNLTIYSDSVNTNTWLTEHGFISRDLESMGGVTTYFETE